MTKLKFPKGTPSLFTEVDYALLKEQKAVLISTISYLEAKKAKILAEGLDGILHLVDSFQDYVVDVLGIPEHEVMLMEDTGLKATKGGELKVGDKIKQVWLCPHCGSDNVEAKMWVKPNSDEIADTDVAEEEDGYCNDCEKHGKLILAEIKEGAEIVGFQVVGDENFGDPDEIHPDMGGSFCLYSLSQARFMVGDSNEWKIIAIWTDDVEEPTMMFEGDPRG